MQERASLSKLAHNLRGLATELEQNDCVSSKSTEKHSTYSNGGSIWAFTDSSDLIKKLQNPNYIAERGQKPPLSRAPESSQRSSFGIGQNSLNAICNNLRKLTSDIDNDSRLNLGAASPTQSEAMSQAKSEEIKKHRVQVS